MFNLISSRNAMNKENQFGLEKTLFIYFWHGIVNLSESGW